jgi:hypothetical protein
LQSPVADRDQDDRYGQGQPHRQHPADDKRQTGDLTINSNASLVITYLPNRWRSALESRQAEPPACLLELPYGISSIPSNEYVWRTTARRLCWIYDQSRVRFCEHGFPVKEHGMEIPS